MKNSEKFVTAQERAEAFKKWCEVGESNWCHERCCDTCALYWLDLEAEEEKPLPCIYCGSECEVENDSQGWSLIQCTSCNYSSCGFKTRKDAIAAHNRVAKKCRESEGKA